MLWNTVTCSTRPFATIPVTLFFHLTVYSVSNQTTILTFSLCLWTGSNCHDMKYVSDATVETVLAWNPFSFHWASKTAHNFTIFISLPSLFHHCSTLLTKITVVRSYQKAIANQVYFYCSCFWRNEDVLIPSNTSCWFLWRKWMKYWITESLIKHFEIMHPSTYRNLITTALDWSILPLPPWLFAAKAAFGLIAPNTQPLPNPFKSSAVVNTYQS